MTFSAASYIISQPSAFVPHPSEPRAIADNTYEHPQVFEVLFYQSKWDIQIFELRDDSCRLNVAYRLRGLRWIRSCGYFIGGSAHIEILPPAENDASIPPCSYILLTCTPSKYCTSCANRPCVQCERTRCWKQRNLATRASSACFMAHMLLYVIFWVK